MVERTGGRRAPRRAWRLGLGVIAMVAAATGCLTDLSAPDQLGPYAVVFGNNSAGVMIGDNRPDIFSPGHPVRFAADGTETPLEDPAGVLIVAFDVNDRGDLMGVAYEESGPRAFDFFPIVWDDAGKLVSLRPLLGAADVAGASFFSTVLTDSGLVVGDYDVLSSPAEKDHGIFLTDLVARRTTFVPARNPWVADANDAGVVVGSDAGGPARWVPGDGGYVREAVGHGFQPTGINTAGAMAGLLADGYPAVWEAGAPEPTRLDHGDPALHASRGYVDDLGHLYFEMERGSDDARPVRWKSADSTPESFPADRWASASISDVNDRGAAVGYAYDVDGLGHAYRWDFD